MWLKGDEGAKRRAEFDREYKRRMNMRDPVIREDVFNSQLQEMSREDLVDWCLRAIDIISSGIANKLTKDNVTVYKVKNIIRVDVKVE